MTKRVLRLCFRPAHDHTRALGEIIEKDMSQYKMTEAQHNNLELLKMDTGQ